MRRLKVLIADDHRLMLHSIRLALEADDEIEIVAEVDSGTKVSHSSDRPGQTWCCSISGCPGSTA